MLFPLPWDRRSSFTAFSRGWLLPDLEGSLRTGIFTRLRRVTLHTCAHNPGSRARDHACYRATCGYSSQYQEAVSLIDKCNCEMIVYMYTAVYRRISQTQTSTARTAKHNAKWHRCVGAHMALETWSTATQRFPCRSTFGNAGRFSVVAPKE
jgi:hypothetical protein